MSITSMNNCIHDFSTSAMPSKFFCMPKELNIYFSFFHFFYFIFSSLTLFYCFILLFHLLLVLLAL